MPLPPPPAFLIIGAQKGGTRWLRLNLGRHPQIYTPDEELAFFNTPAHDRGLDHYRSLFSGWSGEHVVGEATPGYMIWRHEPATVAARIDRSLPEVRLFAILRDPVDRLYSAFVHHVRRGRIDPDEDIRELVRRVPPEQDPRQLVAGGWYARSLAPYFDRFGERLQVVLNDDVRGDPAAVYTGALRVLGVDDSFVPADLEEVVFSRSLPEGTRYWQEGRGRRSLTAEEKSSLFEFFADDVARLEGMLERDLAEWRHG